MGHAADPSKNPALHDVASHHSHSKMYLRNAITLTVLTVIEIAALFVPEWFMDHHAWVYALAHDIVPPLMVILAAVKFALVVGLFMHLADDAGVFKLVFLAPLVMALAMILVMSMMVMRHWETYDKTYTELFTTKDKATRLGLKKESGGGAEPKLSAAEYDKLYEAAKGDFSKGEAIFKSKCAACHKADGGGLPGLGPNMTDDCYKNGGRIVDFVKVITNGVSGTAMVPMSSQINEDEITQVALYVRSLRGKNVAGGKECEGDKAE